MPAYKTLFRVLLSSPSDLPSERGIVRKIVDEINEIHKESSFGLQLYTWEDDVAPSLTMHTPQIDIDKVFSYNTSDLIIGLFYSKVGTPVLGDESGTIHEIKQAIESFKQRKKPEIKLYFKNFNVKLSDTSAEQREKYEQVERIKKQYQSLGIVQDFSTPSSFEKLARRHINQYFNDCLQVYSGRGHSADTMISIKPRGVFERMDTMVDKAIGDVLILGINLEGALNIRQKLLQKANEKVNVRLLALAPNGKALEQFNVNDVSVDVKRQKIKNNLELLSRELDHPHVEIRIIDNMFSSECTGIDINTPMGRIVSQQYLFRIPTSDAPILDIYSDESPSCFETYRKYLENLWDAAKRYKRGEE